MRTKVSVVTGPTGLLISLDEARDHLHLDHEDDDLWLMGAIQAVTARAEALLGRALQTQTLEAAWDAWPGRMVVLPMPPLVSVTSVKYYDEAGTEATVASADYLVDARSTPGRVLLKANKSWPAVTLQEANGVVVRYVAGYDSPNAAPADIKQALLLWLGELYEYRENAVAAGSLTAIPNAAEKLLLKHRMELV